MDKEDSVVAKKEKKPVEKKKVVKKAEPTMKEVVAAIKYLASVHSVSTHNELLKMFPSFFTE